MGFLFSIDWFLSEKACGHKKFEKVFFLNTFLPTGIFAILEFFCLVQSSFLDLDCLYIDAAIPHRRRIGGERGGWGGGQVLWKPSGVVVQVAGFVTVPGGSLFDAFRDWSACGRTCYNT